MKRMIKSNIDHEVVKKHIDIEVEIDMNNLDEGPIAAATYKGFYIPEGPLLPQEKDAVIDSQALEDYHAFIQSVEDLLTDYYDLEVYYKNDSPDHSFYFGMLAKSKDGAILIDFDFTLRVSNHPAKSSPQSKYNKKQKAEALKTYTKGKRSQPVTRSIVVNENRFDSYSDAYLEVDKQVEDVVSILKKKEALHSKKK